MDPVSCCPTCQTQIAPLSIPGPQGPAGADGAAGVNGVSGFTLTTANFTSQADLTTAFNISVADSEAFVVGQNIIAGQGPGAALASPGPCAMVITAIPSLNVLTVKNLRVADESVTVSAGAVVSVSGFLPATPITIAQGGTNAITKAAAQTSLGLGQDSLVSSGATLAQNITAVSTQVGTIDIQLTAAGVWEIRGFVSIDIVAVTFAASPRTITARIRNITQGVNLADGIFHMQNTAAVTFPTMFLNIPPVKYTAGIAADHIQLFIFLDVAITGGTLTVDAGSLEAVPLRFS